MQSFLKALGDWLAPRAKAVAAGAVPALLAFLSLKADGVSADDWALILGLLFGVSGTVYAIPNAAKKPAAPKS